MSRKRLVLLIFFLLCLAIGVTLFWSYRDLHAPVAHSKAGEYIEIPRGSTPTEIVDKLIAEGVIRHSWPLLVYIKLTGAASRLKAGEYRFPSPISPLGVLRKLEEGEQRLSRFTVIEGWTRWDIAASMARLPELKLDSADAALALMNDVSEIRDLDPTAENLEGYLYPDTYNFPPDTTAQTMIRTMVRRFRQEWKPEWTEQARALNMTPRRIVTIASLIETEAKLKDERPLVASVIYNRLQKKMALGIDSSVIYASKLAGKWKNDGKVYKSDIDRRSPYNTRLVTGLPPGPIASPSASSLEAALYPAQTAHLYYVREPARNDGAHNFYDNEADFSRGVQALRNWERERDARSAANRNANSMNANNTNANAPGL
ncbi:MAG TPA: endolytic transglycosylase MltG [Pyrinomonadaceae bacterium]|nr:endolytic transglycosylase MltG [Pyrinomonadaceae bacterium]